MEELHQSHMEPDQFFNEHIYSENFAYQKALYANYKRL